MKWTSLLWHAPGRTWAGMMAANPSALKIWLQAGAQVAMTIFAAAIVGIVWVGPWSGNVEAKRLDGLVWIALGCLVIIMVYAVAITATNLSLHAGKDGLNLGIGQDDEAGPAPADDPPEDPKWPR
jgi:hypothetical protein